MKNILILKNNDIQQTSELHEYEEIQKEIAANKISLNMHWRKKKGDPKTRRYKEEKNRKQNKLH